MFKDYYAILGIPPNSSFEEIRKAYRKQASKWHPDRNPGKNTTDKMQEINEAKLILLDEEARKLYDIEYLKFINFKKKEFQYQQNQRSKEWEKQQSTNNSKRSKSTSQTQNSESSSFESMNEILNKWIQNARTQSRENLREMLKEFGDSSKLAFETFISTAIKGIGVAMIFYIIFFLTKSMFQP